MFISSHRGRMHQLTNEYFLFVKRKRKHCKWTNFSVSICADLCRQWENKQESDRHIVEKNLLNLLMKLQQLRLSPKQVGVDHMNPQRLNSSKVKSYFFLDKRSLYEIHNHWENQSNSLKRKRKKKHHKQDGFIFYANDDRQCLTDLSGILNKNTNSPVFFPEQFNMMRVRERFNWTLLQNSLKTNC